MGARRRHPLVCGRAHVAWPGLQAHEAAAALSLPLSELWGRSVVLLRGRGPERSPACARGSPEGACGPVSAESPSRP